MDIAPKSLAEYLPITGFSGLPGWAIPDTWLNVCGANPLTGAAGILNRKLIIYKTTDGTNYEQVSDNMAPFLRHVREQLNSKNDSTMIVLIRNNACGLMLTQNVRVQ